MPDPKDAAGEGVQVHYDLGIAYAEMGMRDPAICELQTALALFEPGDPRASEVRALLTGTCDYNCSTTF